ncbi:uncharacterized protein LOC101900606 [Musca domestica]|uniref:Uncharacterized protein LOC101900606 n=1 Tax=Musca domestica TaxID=7370 RepID=A0A1I8MYX8_MUSDO|nr:uncharacterized protein LOC101900606 [Musca domestica]XP_058981596.1 uncharacterized protein LOC101900606 [Musca domestica]
MSYTNTAPPSESSEGTNSSDNNEMLLTNPEWTHETQNDDINAAMSTIYAEGAAYSSDTNSIDMINHNILSDYEIEQVECFFAGLGTEIFVSSALANLYEGRGQENDWQLKYTGIPVILYDKGSTRTRTIKRITLVLAERGSCFALWSDRVSNLSNYQVAGPSFHTMTLSSNPEQMIGFSYDTAGAAAEIWLHLERLLSDPENNLRTLPRDKERSKRVRQVPLPPKAQISQPCQFHHVTSVTKDDGDRYYSLQAFVASMTQR